MSTEFTELIVSFNAAAQAAVNQEHDDPDAIRPLWAAVAAARAAIDALNHEETEIDRDGRTRVSCGQVCLHCGERLAALRQTSQFRLCAPCLDEVFPFRWRDLDLHHPKMMVVYGHDPGARANQELELYAAARKRRGGPPVSAELAGLVARFNAAAETASNAHLNDVEIRALWDAVAAAREALALMATLTAADEVRAELARPHDPTRRQLDRFADLGRLTPELLAQLDGITEALRQVRA